MPLPTAYTEATLAGYMQRTLKHFAGVLGWTEVADYSDAVNEAVRLYGAESVEAATNLMRLEDIARAVVWKHAMQGAAGDFTFGGLAGTYNRDQLFQHAKTMLAIESDNVTHRWGIVLKSADAGSTSTPLTAVW